MTGWLIGGSVFAVGVTTLMVALCRTAADADRRTEQLTGPFDQDKAEYLDDLLAADERTRNRRPR